MGCAVLPVTRGSFDLISAAGVTRSVPSWRGDQDAEKPRNGTATKQSAPYAGHSTAGFFAPCPGETFPDGCTVLVLDQVRDAKRKCIIEYHNLATRY